MSFKKCERLSFKKRWKIVSFKIDGRWCHLRKVGDGVI